MLSDTLRLVHPIVGKSTVTCTAISVKKAMRLFQPGYSHSKSCPLFIGERDECLFEFACGPKWNYNQNTDSEKPAAGEKNLAS